MPRLNPLFQHRHYAKIAAVIASMPATEPVRLLTAAWFSASLLETNPNFDGERFVAAAMGNPSRRDK